MSSRRSGVGVWLLGAALSIGAPIHAAMAEAPAGVSGAERCSSLTGKSLGSAVVLQATLDSSGGLGHRCVLSAALHQSLHFRVELPDTWNRRLLFYGGGGWDGSIPALRLSPAPALAAYVIVASDGGHTASPIDAGWALHNPQGQIDFAFLSVHSVLAAAKVIARDYYRRESQHYYFEGCSNGGREALIEASRFPADFDGIIARSPAYNWTALMSVFARNAQRQLGAPGWAISSAGAGLIEKAALAKCDAQDGLKDGIISNPDACHPDLDQLRCKPGSSESCLTDEQVRTAKTFYSELRSPDGSLLYPAWGPGGEQEGWDAWLIGAVPGGRSGTAPPGPPMPPGGAQAAFADGFVKFWVTADPHFDLLRFDPSQHAAAMALAGSLLDASPDLSTFFALGHKLILWHGTADWAISFRGSIDYFKNVASAVGGERQRDESMEFFLAPGVEHCAGGAGADVVDLLTPLSNWVERGQRPAAEDLAAHKNDQNGRPVLSRPLCRYPAFPKYQAGDPALANSFRCSTN